MPQLLAHANKLGLKALPITDIHSLSGTVEFLNEIKKNKYPIKPLIGCHVRIRETDNSIYYVTLFCKNKTGWYSLIRILAESDIYQETLSVRKELLLKYNAGLICVIGGIDSPLLVWRDSQFFKDLISTYQGRFFLLKEDINTNYNQTIINELIDTMHLPELVANPCFYYEATDRLYQQILICSKNKVTMKESGILAEQYDSIFFDESNELHLKNTYAEGNQALVDMIEPFDFKGKPHLPDAHIPKEYKNADEYLTALCRIGWKNLLQGKFSSPEMQKIYGDRVKMELGGFTAANLSNYILIVWDITNYCHQNNFGVGIRGSAVSSIVGYLIGISDVDPIIPDVSLPYHPDRSLLFERFYNDGRNDLSTGRISLPDIDIDTEIFARPHVINYLKDKYGHDTVSSIITYGRSDGRNCIKEVFRILEPCDNHYEVCNRITKAMLDTAKIQDVLEDIRQEKPDYTTVEYNIDNIPIVANLAEEYPDIFDNAIKLSGLINKQSRHAAGIVIGDKPLAELFPVTKDIKTGDLILALEMEDAESIHAVKIDILGLAAYDKISKIMDMITNNLNEPIVGLSDDFVESI